MNQAKLNGNNKPLEINGIPLAMLEATGSTRDMLEGLPQIPPSSQQQPQPEQQGHQQRAPPTPATQQSHSRQGSVAPPVVLKTEPLLTAPQPQLQPQPSQQFTLPQAPFILGNSPIPQSYLPKIDEVGLPTEIKDEAVASQISSFFEQQTNGWLSNENHDDDF